MSTWHAVLAFIGAVCAAAVVVTSGGPTWVAVLVVAFGVAAVGFALAARRERMKR
jgi:hypothetical protein